MPRRIAGPSPSSFVQPPCRRSTASCQGVVVFVRLKVMPPGGDGNTCRAQRARKGGGIVWRAVALAHGQRQILQIAATPRRQPAELLGQEMEAQRVQFRIALNAQS